MLHVPSVTMNGGSRSRVTRMPLTQPQAMPVKRPMGKRQPDRHAALHRQPSHDDRRQHHDRADRKVDAGSEDDERLGDAEHGDDRHLLQHQRQVERREEAAAGEEAEDQHAEDEDEERNRRRIGVEEVLQAAERAAALFLEDRDGRIDRRGRTCSNLVAVGPAVRLLSACPPMPLCLPVQDGRATVAGLLSPCSAV